MKVFDKLNRKNFKLYASQHYNNPECLDVNEFKEDLSRFKYVKRLLSRYEAHSDLQERLILNHLIVIYNCFGIEASNRMLWYKIKESHWHYIKPFLVFLRYIKNDEYTGITMDPNVVEKLRKI